MFEPGALDQPAEVLLRLDEMRCRRMRRAERVERLPGCRECCVQALLGSKDDRHLRPALLLRGAYRQRNDQIHELETRCG